MLIPRHRLLISCAPHLTLEKVHALEIRAHTFNVPSMGGQRPKGNTVVESTSFTHMSHINHIIQIVLYIIHFIYITHSQKNVPTPIKFFNLWFGKCFVVI